MLILHGEIETSHTHLLILTLKIHVPYIIMYWCILAGGVQSAFQQLKEYEVQLKAIVRKRFDAAVELKNPEEITRSSNFVHDFFIM